MGKIEDYIVKYELLVEYFFKRPFSFKIGCYYPNVKKTETFKIGLVAHTTTEITSYEPSDTNHVHAKLEYMALNPKLAKTVAERIYR